jgi:hypothetical protein
VADQQIRAVDVGRSHVDVGVVYRNGVQADGSAVAEHEQVSEVYYIIDGSGTLVTGPDIVDWKARPADNPAVRLLNGPGGNGSTIRNGVAHELKAGRFDHYSGGGGALVHEGQRSYSISDGTNRSG